MRVPWTSRRSNQSILKEINLESSLEVLKLQYSGHLIQRASSLAKPLMLGKIEGRRRRGPRRMRWLEGTTDWIDMSLSELRELVMPSNHLILCHPLLLLPSVFPSIQVFSSESVLHIRWPNFWRFSFSISPSNEHSRLISFRIDWFDLLAVQVTLKSLLQHHGWKALILHSGFFIVQLSHPHMTTEKNINLTIQTFVGKVIFLLFNMLLRFFIAFLPRTKHLLISWQQSLSTAIL